MVEFEEAKRLITVGRIPQLRLALILLDSAVELILYGLAEYALRAERFEFTTLNQMKAAVKRGKVRAWRTRSTGSRRG
ncbi:hypothetical protein OG763_09785 [Streptomyces sp. NBC_01230]|uniref:hypothetical protein n=1 Tax=Streptomyces sp. NBC_01230 TaxID=2903784 RepID=UPI002E133DF2|nr:hypothetical protein OG763_09785 [Streptomyces sp. NBC_01230]